ncbi:ankyrin repeat-containing protein [Anaeramoeba flamelloides]|uniref:Ankyrin repeat-containing protein n=1 Tax=Anaeramoeba flamelloides TaxID=1746091 RepID=A0ABQ8YGQ7_9EUKA|nr:ankyrin repeat-containing protein [Anaeramoeba flamelloides]
MNYFKEIAEHVSPSLNWYEYKCNRTKCEGMDLFTYAAYHNNLEWIIYIWTHFSDTGVSTYETRNSALHVCIKKKCNLELIKYLVDEVKYCLNLKNIKLQTPLHLCCKIVKSTRILRYFLRHRVDPNSYCQDKKTCLEYLLENKHVTLNHFELLYEFQSKPKLYPESKNIYSLLLKHDLKFEFFDYFYEKGFRIKEHKMSSDQFSWKPLGGEMLMDPEYSAVVRAIEKHSDLHVIKWLLKHGASENVNCFNGTLLHHCAFYHSSRELLSLLLANTKLTIDMENFHKETPLMVALKSKATKEMISNLIQLGSDVNHKNWQGNNCLHIAFLNNCEIAIIMLLLSAGADAKETNAQGKTPIDVQGNSFLKIHSSIIFDFLSLIEEDSKTDLKLTSKDGSQFHCHKDLLKVRLLTDIKSIETTFAKFTKREITIFLTWAYSGISETGKNTKLVKKILFSLGVGNQINLKNNMTNFMLDIRKMYEDEEGKDFTILVPKRSEIDKNEVDHQEINKELKKKEVDNNNRGDQEDNVENKKGNGKGNGKGNEKVHGKENENEKTFEINKELLEKEKEFRKEIEKENGKQIEINKELKEKEIKKEIQNEKEKEIEKVIEIEIEIEKTGKQEEAEGEKEETNIGNYDDKFDLDNTEKIPIKIHSLILQARSDLYRGMFLISNEDNLTEVTDYSGASPDTIRAFVRYLYTDEIEHGLPNRILRELRELEEYYQLSLSSNLSFTVTQILKKRKKAKQEKIQRRLDLKNPEIKPKKKNRVRSRSRGRGKRKQFKKKKRSKKKKKKKK